MYVKSWLVRKGEGNLGKEKEDGKIIGMGKHTRHRAAKAPSTTTTTTGIDGRESWGERGFQGKII